MTLIAATIMEDVGYILADSLLTGRSQEDPVTTMGQSVAGHNVSEASLKIHHIGDMAVAYAGSVVTGSSFIDVLQGEIARGSGPKEALESAFRSNQPQEDDQQFEAVAIWRDAAKRSPVMMAVNQQGVVSVPANALLILGSSRPETRRLVFWLLKLIHELSMSPDARLAAMLTMAACVSSRRDLVSEKVGGTFAGILVDAEGPRFHPDIAYLLVDTIATTDVVISYCADGSHIVRSSVLDRTWCFLHRHPAVSIEEWQSKHVRRDESWAERPPRFLAIINTVLPVACLLELDNLGRHALLDSGWSYSRINSERAVIGLRLKPELGRAIVDPTPEMRRGTDPMFGWCPKDQSEMYMYHLQLT